MIVNSHDIVSRKFWQPFFRLFQHCVGVSMDGGHVNGFVNLFFLRTSHWSKGKGTMKKGFDNERFKGRHFLVNFRRFEAPQGKGLKRRRVLGRQSRQMSFKKCSSKVERECPLGGVSK
jgi:hypothetical protein